jgi:hypothetical protein
MIGSMSLSGFQPAAISINKHTCPCSCHFQNLCSLKVPMTDFVKIQETEIKHFFAFMSAAESAGT